MNAPFERHLFRRRVPKRVFRRKVQFEALEQRLLLSADGVGPNAAQLIESVDSDQLTATLAQESQASPTVIVEALRAQLRAVAWANQPIDSGFVELDTADPDVRRIASLDGTLDALIGSSGRDNEWRITGEDTVTLNGVEYSGVNVLLGGADNEDVFIVEERGTLGGYLDGGPGGFDTLVIDGGSFGSVAYTASGPDSGTVALDDNLIRYFGLEPIANTGTTADAVFAATAGSDQIRLLDAGSGNLRIESANGTFENVTFPRPTSSLTIIGGGGDDLYRIEVADFGTLRITETAGGGDDTLEFIPAASGFPAGSTISYTDQAVEHVVGVALNASALLAGLESLVGWADTLDNAGTLGQALAVITGNVGVGVGSSLDLADVFEQLRVDIKALVDGLPAGTSLTSEMLAARLAAFQKTGVTHFDRSIVGDTRAPVLLATDVFSFAITLDSDSPVSLTGIQGNADLQAFVDALNASIAATALVGRVQAIKTDDGRIGFQVIDAAVDTFTLTAGGAAGKLGLGAGPVTKENLTKVLGGLGKLNVGVSGTVVPELTFAADGTAELRFRFHYAADRSSQFNIDLGEEAAKQGVSFDPGTSLKVKSALEADLALGMTLGANARFFLDVGSLDLSATNTGADADHTNLSGDVKIGFLGASLVDPGGATDLAPQISLFAGVNLDAGLAGLTAFDASEQTQVLDSLEHDQDNALNIRLPIKVKPGIPLFEPLVEIRFESSDDAVVFTGEQLPLRQPGRRPGRDAGRPFHRVRGGAEIRPHRSHGLRPARGAGARFPGEGVR